MNDKNNTEAYPLPCIGKIFLKNSGANFLAKINLSNANWQNALAEKSQEACTANTTRELFQSTRRQQRLKNQAAVFQQVKSEMLKRLIGSVAYQDDILL